MRLTRCYTAVRRLSTAAAPAGSAALSGISSKPIIGASRSTLVKTMMNAIDMPGRFLPVSSVHVRPAEGEAGEDGALWRSITHATSGDTLQEHIYANPSKGEIRYVGLDADGKSEGELEVVHSLVKNKENGSLCIEYFMRNRETRQRVDWTAMHSLDEAENAIETTIALARAKECQIADPNFVGVKA